MSTVWRLFQDVEALHGVAIATQIERVTPLIVDVDPTGPVEDRVKRLVDTRAKLYEAITPIRRFAVRLSASSEPIRADLRLANGFLRAQVSEVFAAELAARGSDTLEGADAVTSWEAWDRFRSGQGLSVRRAKAAVATSLLALLAQS
jgi:hypothetical protein